MAFDTYIKIDTVDGEATQANHEKWIEIYSFSWGASNPTTVGSGRRVCRRARFRSRASTS